MRRRRLLGRNRGGAVAQSFIDIAGLTDPTQISALQQLESDLKSNSLWDKMVAVYPIVGATAHSHKFNLIDPRDADNAFRLLITGATNLHSNTGLKFNDGGHANTFLSGFNVLSKNNTHLSTYCKTDSNGAFVDMGCSTSLTSQFNLYARYNGLAYSDQYSNSGSGRISTAVPTSLGFTASSRVNSNSHKLYKNGIKIKESLAESTLEIPNSPIHLGQTNSGSFYVTNREYAFFSIGHGLTDAENTIFNTIVQQYQTTLSRQV